MLIEPQERSSPLRGRSSTASLHPFRHGEVRPGDHGTAVLNFPRSSSAASSVDDAGDAGNSHEASVCHCFRDASHQAVSTLLIIAHHLIIAHRRRSGSQSSRLIASGPAPSTLRGLATFSTGKVALSLRTTAESRPGIEHIISSSRTPESRPLRLRRGIASFLSTHGRLSVQLRTYGMGLARSGPRERE